MKEGPKRKQVAVSGPEYFGLSNPIVTQLIQELPNADKCGKYKWKQVDLPSAEGDASTPGAAASTPTAPARVAGTKHAADDWTPDSKRAKLATPGRTSSGRVVKPTRAASTADLSEDESPRGHGSAKGSDAIDGLVSRVLGKGGRPGPVPAPVHAAHAHAHAAAPASVAAAPAATEGVGAPMIEETVVSLKKPAPKRPASNPFGSVAKKVKEDPFARRR